MTAMLAPSIGQRVFGRFKAHTGALAPLILGGQLGGVGGAIAGAVAPEALAMPAFQMMLARGMGNLSNWGQRELPLGAPALFPINRRGLLE